LGVLVLIARVLAGHADWVASALGLVLLALGVGLIAAGVFVL
jgi:hypothetical protein